MKSKPVKTQTDCFNLKWIFYYPWLVFPAFLIVKAPGNFLCGGREEGRERVGLSSMSPKLTVHHFPKGSCMGKSLSCDCEQRSETWHFYELPGCWESNLCRHSEGSKPQRHSFSWVWIFRKAVFLSTTSFYWFLNLIFFGCFYYFAECLMQGSSMLGKFCSYPRLRLLLLLFLASSGLLLDPGYNL